MNPLTLPWLELAVVLPLLGAASIRVVGRGFPASRCCLVFSAAALGSAVLASVAHYTGGVTPAFGWDRPAGGLLAMDELSAPLVPLIALLHFLTALSTAKTKMATFSFAGLLAAESVRLAAFACNAPWLLIGLLALDASWPVFEARWRGQPGRLRALHALVFLCLVAAGWFCVDALGWFTVGSILLLLGVLARTGAIPAVVWVSDLFANGSFGTALLFAAPLAAVNIAVRLALPIAPEWSLEGFGCVALATAVYGAGRSVVQVDARQFFAYLMVSQAALVLVGLGLHTPFAVTGALVMWLSSALALSGLGLTLRAIEARVGPLSMNDYRGLYDQSAALAVCFLVTGLAAVGFPATTGFVAIELLVDEAVGAHLAVGLVVVLAAALNGIAVVRAYLLLFTGRRHATGVSLAITPRERVAVLTLMILILGGGLIPQAYLESRHRAAEAVLGARESLRE